MNVSRNKILSYGDAFFFALMVGGGETYFTAYSLSLGHSSMEAGLLSTLPLGIGGVFQLITPSLFNRLKNYKLWLALCSAIQSLLFLIPICRESIAYENLFAMVCVYWTLFFSSSSVWTGLMSQLIAANEFGKFFTARSALTYLGILIGLISAGTILEYTQNFTLVFIACLLCRLISSGLIFLMGSEKVMVHRLKQANFNFKKDFLAYPEISKLAFFVLLFKFGVYFSASFFTPYMLMELQFSYVRLTMVLAISFVGRIIVMRIIRNFVDEIQYQQLFTFSCIGLTLIPILWLVDTNYYYILALEIFSGSFWGAFEMIFLLATFQKLNPERNANFMLTFNLLNSLVVVFGGVLGALLFKYHQEWMQFNPYALVFIISTLIRSFTLIFIPEFKIKKINIRILPFLKPLGPRPNMGVMERVSWKLYERRAKFKLSLPGLSKKKN